MRNDTDLIKVIRRHYYYTVYTNYITAKGRYLA